jgi:xanthine/uracil permease
MNQLGDLFLNALIAFLIGFVIGCIILVAIFFVDATLANETRLKAPPPMTLEETQQFFQTFKLEAGQ